jgi:O-antigen/teichoic acid export membrane protein
MVRGRKVNPGADPGRYWIKTLRAARYPHMNWFFGLHGLRYPVMINRQALNIVANFSGVGARLIFSLVFNIIYFRLLGSESYGLIGFYASLAALSALFDFGLNQTTMREVARREGDQDRAGELRSVVFTLQFLLCGVGLSLGLMVGLCAHWIAASWFSAAQLAIHEITISVALMGCALALQFPVNFYYGTLIGLQRQVLSNSIIVAATALRGVLTIAALIGFGSSPAIFFVAQTVASAVEIAVLGYVSAECAQRQFSVISGANRFHHASLSLSEQPREQQGGFHLRTCYRHRVINRR